MYVCKHKCTNKKLYLLVKLNFPKLVVVINCVLSFQLSRNCFTKHLELKVIAIFVTLSQKSNRNLGFYFVLKIKRVLNSYCFRTWNGHFTLLLPFLFLGQSILIMMLYTSGPTSFYLTQILLFLLVH